MDHSKNDPGDDDGYQQGVENAKEILESDELAAFSLTAVTKSETAASISGVRDGFPTRLLEGEKSLSPLDVEVFLLGFRIAESHRALRKSGFPVHDGQYVEALIQSAAGFDNQMTPLDDKPNRNVYDIRPNEIRERDRREAAEDDADTEAVSIEIDGPDDDENDDDDGPDGAGVAPEQ